MVFLKQCPELLLVFIEMNGCFQLLCIQLFEKECIFNTMRKKIKQDLLQLTGVDGSTKCRESYMESGDDPVIAPDRQNAPALPARNGL